MTHNEAMILLQTIKPIPTIPAKGFACHITVTGKITVTGRIVNCTLEHQEVGISLFEDYVMLSTHNDMEYVNIFFYLESSTVIKYGKRYTFKSGTNRVVVNL